MRRVFNDIPLYESLDQYLEHYFNSDCYHSAIPILEKREIAEKFPLNYMTDRVKRAIDTGGIEYASTSGTSSEKLMLMRPIDWWKEEFRRGYKYSPTLVGYSMYENRKTCLSTAVCSSSTCYMDNPSYEERILGNTLYLNSQPDPNRWTEEDINRMIEEMWKFSADLLEVDPVYLAIFLRKCIQFDLIDKIFQPKYITCSYEFLTQSHRDYIQQYFHCPVMSMYGSTELGVLFIQDDNEAFFRCPERSIVELVPFDEKKRLYELVVTSWKNEFMPLLRYRTRDIVEISNTDEMRCKTSKKLKFMEHEELSISRLHGRINDTFFTEKGDLVTAGILDEKLQRCNLVPWQYQLEISSGRITFRYILPLGKNKEEFSPKDNFSFLYQWFPSSNAIDFLEVHSLRNEGSGKYRTICGSNTNQRGS